jgi:hypothetical protein
MKSSSASSGPIQCRITVRGRLALHWSRWLGELQISYLVSGDGDVVTDLYGNLVDQSALQGVLKRIWDLNLTVLSVVTSKGNAVPDNPPQTDMG